MKLAKRREQIESEELLVLYQDECHFCWGDVLGYVWGKRGQRTQVPVSNEKIRQTYFGCVNPRDGQALVKKYPAGNTDNTLKFLKYLNQIFPNKRLFIVWDKASYHTSSLVKQYLRQINRGLAKKDWKITLALLPTAAPEENPIETIWLKAKNHVRSMFEECETFADVKRIFEEYISNNIFDFEKLDNFGCFS
ncbi:MAG: IS630 family transposase [Bacteroidota bacterium]